MVDKMVLHLCLILLAMHFLSLPVSGCKFTFVFEERVKHRTPTAVLPTIKSTGQKKIKKGPELLMGPISFRVQCYSFAPKDYSVGLT